VSQGEHEHASLASPERAEPGNGLLLFFRVDDFDVGLKRARGLMSRFEEAPTLSPATATRCAIWLRSCPLLT